MRAFNYLRRMGRRFLAEESGATAVEYAILVAFVVLVCVAGVAAFRVPAGSAFGSSTNNIGTYPDP
jgi:Flp pilus assembly pilin Flp